MEEQWIINIIKLIDFSLDEYKDQLWPSYFGLQKMYKANFVELDKLIYTLGYDLIFICLFVIIVIFY